MKKSISIAYIALFVLLLIAPTLVFGICGKYIDQENYEKRETAEKPVFSLDAIDSFPAAYEEYYNDNLPFRSHLIEANSLANYYLFRHSPIKKVVIGDDGWLFYNPQGGDGDPMADSLGTNMPTEEQLNIYAQNLLNARNLLEQQGKELVILVAPNKESMYGAFLPSSFSANNTSTKADAIVSYLRENTDLTVVYPKEDIQEAMAQYPEKDFYYKTDTHWNQLGAYVAARELLEALEIELPDLEQVRISENQYISGDLAGMMGLAKHLKYDLDYTVEGYPAGESIQMEYPIEDNTQFIHYSTENMDPRSVCIVRDSFTTAMAPYVYAQFNNCYLVHWNTNYREILSQIDSDIIVLEVVERYTGYLMTFTTE